MPPPTHAMGASVEEPGVACGTCTEAASVEEEEECGICKEALCASTAAALDGCRHRFCGPCILRWASVESTCPFCKSRFKSVRLPGGSPSKGKGKNIVEEEEEGEKEVLTFPSSHSSSDSPLRGSTRRRLLCEQPVC